MISMMKISEGQPVAYSYIRWSTAIQEDGDSLRRQKQKAVDWSAKTGIPLADDRIMIDAGVSAFKGKNLKDGAFGAFLQRVKEGKIPQGSYLLVEAFDRFSRMDTVSALTVFLNIIDAGIVLVTLVDDKEYRKGHIDKRDLEDSIDEMEFSHKFSKRLRTRITDSWIGRYQTFKETGVVPTSNLLAWLTFDPATRKVVLIEKRAAIVRIIFDMCISGCGLPKIAKTLSERGIANWAAEKRKDRSTYWTVSGIDCILKNPAVYGEYQPRKNGEIFPVPAVISKDDFHRAQAAKAKRRQIGMGRKGTFYSNLFSGLAKCSACGEPMTIRNPKRGRQTQFYCKGTLHGQCKTRPWLYPIFEQAFLAFVNEIDLQAIIHGGTDSRSDTITNELQALEGQKIAMQKSLAAFVDMIRKNPALSDTIIPAMDDDQKKLNAINAQMKALETERHQISSHAIAAKESNLTTFPTDVSADELYQLRAKAAQHIRTIVERIELRRDAVTGTMAGFMVKFVGGQDRTVFVNLKNPRKPFAFANKTDDASQFLKELTPIMSA